MQMNIRDLKMQIYNPYSYCSSQPQEMEHLFGVKQYFYDHLNVNAQRWFIKDVIGDLLLRN